MLSFFGVIFCLLAGAVGGVVGLYFIACKNAAVKQFILDKINSCGCSDGTCS